MTDTMYRNIGNWANPEKEIRQAYKDLSSLLWSPHIAFLQDGAERLVNETGTPGRNRLCAELSKISGSISTLRTFVDNEVGYETCVKEAHTIFSGMQELLTTGQIHGEKVCSLQDLNDLRQQKYCWDAAKETTQCLEAVQQAMEQLAAKNSLTLS